MAPYNKFRVELCPTEGTKPPRDRLLALIAEDIRVRPQRVIESPSRWAVICSEKTEVEALLSSSGIRALSSIGLFPRAAAEFMAERTIICHRVDPIIWDHTEEEIKMELYEQQDWVYIRNIVKIRPSLMKIVMADTQAAKMAQEYGLNAFYLRIAPQQISPERHVKVQFCLNCYSYEDHSTAYCKNPQKICNNCGGKDHLWKTCKNGTRCFTCGGPHTATSLSCPARREAITKKTEKISANKKKTPISKNTETAKKAGKAQKSYADALSMKTTIQEPMRPLVNVDEAREIMVCVIHAHMVNSAEPGTYARTLNQMLTKNGITKREMWFPENPPTPNLGFTHPVEEHQPSASCADRLPKIVPMEPYDEDTAPAITQKRKISPEKTASSKAKKITSKKIIAEDIDLQLYIPEEVELPQEDPISKDTILNLVAEKALKWRFHSERTDVEVALLLGEIDVPRERCSQLKDYLFKRIKRGNVVDL